MCAAPTTLLVLLKWTGKSVLPTDKTLSASLINLLMYRHHFSFIWLSANTEWTSFFLMQVTLGKFQLVSFRTSEKNCGREHSNASWFKQQ